MIVRNQKCGRMYSEYNKGPDGYEMKYPNTKKDRG